MNIPFDSKPNARRKELPFCYICGRQFTKASLPIHEPQCLKKWEIANEQLAPEFRKKAPVKPKEVPDRAIAGSKGGGGYSMSAQDAAYQAAQANLVACPNCGRTFNMDRIEKHVGICKKTGLIAPKKTAAAPPPSQPAKTEPPKKTPTASAKAKRPPIAVAAAAAAPSKPSGVGDTGGGSKFCSECGAKFENVAKFCTECGAKRA